MIPLLLLTSTTMVLCENMNAGSKPNVVILFVDDWGWGDMGANCLAAAEVPGAQLGHIDKETACDTSTGKTITPNMDALASSGIRFTDFHVGASVCTPSRSAIQTGRMGARTGVTSNFGPGYKSVAIGKWHLGPRGAFAPTSRGYDAYLGLPESHDYGCTDTTMGAPDSGCLQWRNDRCPRNSKDLTPDADQDTTCHPGPVNPWNYSMPLMDGVNVVEQPVDIEGTVTGTPLSHRYSQFAVQFIKNTTASNTPFLVYLAFSHMHVPIVYNPSYHGKSGEKGLLGDALMELDDSVGILIDALEAENVRNNTIIFLTGDNGPPEDQCDWGGSKGPFMGAWQKTGQKGGSAGKMTAWEAGHREVGVISWPGKVKAGAVTHVLASALDFVPTVLELAGVPLPTDRVFDGKDLGHVIFSDDPGAASVDAHHKFLFHSVGGQAYMESDPQGGPETPTGLFQAVRLPGVKAMYQVGYMPQCCRGANGDANTPYNKTCTSPTGAYGFQKTWLSTPLLFNFTVDVAESTPIAPGTSQYATALAAVEAVADDMKVSLQNDMRSHPDYAANLKDKICCNPNNIVCRCHELPPL